MAAPEIHVVKRSAGHWEVRRASAKRGSKTYDTQRAALAAAKTYAREAGGVEVVLHRADGRIDVVQAKSGPSAARTPAANKRPPRAPRTEGERTTLRVPQMLASTIAELADELAISRNDALLRLATRGAELYESERRIAERREARWAAVAPGLSDVDLADLPTPEKARATLLADDDGDETSPE